MPLLLNAWLYNGLFAKIPLFLFLFHEKSCWGIRSRTLDSGHDERKCGQGQCHTGELVHHPRSTTNRPSSTSGQLFTVPPVVGAPSLVGCRVSAIYCVGSALSSHEVLTAGHDVRHGSRWRGGCRWGGGLLTLAEEVIVLGGCRFLRVGEEIWKCIPRDFHQYSH